MRQGGGHFVGIATLLELDTVSRGYFTGANFTMNTPTPLVIVTCPARLNRPTS
jgi:hypothetical protein